MPPELRVIESSQILQGSDEVVIAHGEHRYKLSATRDGRLSMPGASPTLRRLLFVFVSITLLGTGYLAGLPFIAGFCQVYWPASEPILQVVFLPAIFIYENFDPYEIYCDWVLEWMEEIGFLV